MATARIVEAVRGLRAAHIIAKTLGERSLRACQRPFGRPVGAHSARVRGNWREPTEIVRDGPDRAAVRSIPHRLGSTNRSLRPRGRQALMLRHAETAASSRSCMGVVTDRHGMQTCPGCQRGQPHGSVDAVEPHGCARHNLTLLAQLLVHLHISLPAWFFFCELYTKVAPVCLYHSLPCITNHYHSCANTKHTLLRTHAVS